MEPVSSADRFVRLLRQRLEERAKARGPATGSKVGEVRPRGPDGARAVATVLARAGIDDDQLRRSLVEQLLADQLGPNLVNDARFQQVVDDVTQIMATDEAIGPVLTAALEVVRAQGL